VEAVEMSLHIVNTDGFTVSDRIFLYVEKVSFEGIFRKGSPNLCNLRSDYG
jgi:hypothetical protein